MNSAIRQLLECPYTGAVKQIFIESKAIELIAHKLAQFQLPDAKKVTGLKPSSDDVERVLKAEKILRRDIECPPKLLDLAHAVGTNHCTLNKGFMEVFGTTVFGHLREMRLIEARRLMEEEDMNVTQTALAVGYNSIATFSRAFLEFFGRSPSTFLKRRS
jgi:transcriptional regulator GlxA family with amidase domain